MIIHDYLYYLLAMYEFMEASYLFLENGILIEYVCNETKKSIRNGQLRNLRDSRVSSRWWIILVKKPVLLNATKTEILSLLIITFSYATKIAYISARLHVYRLSKVIFVINVVIRFKIQQQLKFKFDYAYTVFFVFLTRNFISFNNSFKDIYAWLQVQSPEF